jgi:hypothetical protein
MAAKTKKGVGAKKGRVKVGKLETVKELSAAEKKKVKGGEKIAPPPPKPAESSGGQNLLAQVQNVAFSLFE